MDVAEMKRLLTKSKSEPVNAAVGLDGKNAVMMLHKMKQPKAVSKELEGKFKGLKNPRWGTAFVDIDDDPKLVILTLNKTASGMGNKLKKTLKGTGFSKVRIKLEDGTIDEDVGEEDEEEEENDAQPNRPPQEQEPQPVAAKGPNDEGSAQTQGGTPASETAQNETGQPEQEAEQFDPSALTQRLTGLVKTMMQVIKDDPSRADVLKDLATKAQAAIKAGTENDATAAVDALASSLMNGRPGETNDVDANAQSGPTAQPGPTAQGTPNGAEASNTPNDASAAAAKPNGAAAPNAAVLQKSRAAWVAARKRIEDEIGKLHEAMSKHYDGHGFGADLDKVFQSKVEPILSSLDHSLASKLDEVGKSTDPAQHQKLVGEAKGIILQYENFLANDSLIPQLDSNPFVPLQIQKTLTATLEALKKSVR